MRASRSATSGGLIGRADEAELRLRRAVEICAALGARPRIARTQIALADLLEAQGDEIISLRAGALEIATDIGAAGNAALIP